MTSRKGPFDRARGADDCARDLAAQQLWGAEARWVAGGSRRHGRVFGADVDLHDLLETPDNVWMDATPNTVSPSGCPIGPDEIVYRTIRYRVVKVGDRTFNAERRKPWNTIGGALGLISDLAQGDDRDPAWDHWRVVELPAGEPWDYDGTVVADLRIGRGVA